jgi:hypothetical protein
VVVEGGCVLVGREQQVGGGRDSDEVEAGGERGDGTCRGVFEREAFARVAAERAACGKVGVRGGQSW